MPVRDCPPARCPTPALLTRRASPLGPVPGEFVVLIQCPGRLASRTKHRS
jgi:hypothetical protein